MNVRSCLSFLKEKKMHLMLTFLLCSLSFGWLTYEGLAGQDNVSAILPEENTMDRSDETVELDEVIESSAAAVTDITKTKRQEPEQAVKAETERISAVVEKAAQQFAEQEIPEHL